MKKIAIIPARGGSKRIPGKNIKTFAKKPMIAHSIEAAMESGLFDIVMVSTDDQEIADCAKAYGAKVPFMRSKQNSDDFSGTGDVMYEVLQEFKKQGTTFDIACCIYATAPLISPKRLQQALKLLLNSDFDATFPVGKFSSSIWRSFKMDESSGTNMIFPEFDKSRSQDLPLSYYDAGQFYWFYTANLNRIPNKNSFGIHKGAVVLEDYEVQDIDEPSDWEMAYLKYIYINNQQNE